MFLLIDKKRYQCILNDSLMQYKLNSMSYFVSDTKRRKTDAVASTSKVSIGEVYSPMMEVT